VIKFLDSKERLADGKAFTMMRLLGSVGIVSGAIAGLLSTPVSAQMDGSYLGTSLNTKGAGATAAELVDTGAVMTRLLQGGSSSAGDAQQYQGRIDFQDAALSLRGNLYVEGDAAAIVPSVTYDFAIREGTNVYLGAGYALVHEDTEIGDRNGVVLSVGAEAELLPGTIFYGNTQLGVNTNSNGDRPLTFQLGVGRSL